MPSFVFHLMFDGLVVFQKHYNKVLGKMFENSCPVVLQVTTRPNNMCCVDWCRVTSITSICDTGITFGGFKIR